MVCWRWRNNASGSDMKKFAQALGLFCIVLCGSVASCKGPESIVVTDYKQAHLYVKKYSKRYDPVKGWKGLLGPPAVLAGTLRRVSEQEPILLCHADQLQEDRPSSSKQYAMIYIDQEYKAFTDENGNYVLSISPGRHTISYGAIDCLKSTPITIQVHSGDSIQINIGLLYDLRPLF